MQEHAHINAPEKLLTEKESAAFLGLENHQTLAVWRCTKRHGLPYLKIGRNVRYRLSDLEGWLNSRLCAG